MTHPTKRALVKDGMAYSSGNLISSVINIVKGFVLARILGPASYGVLSALITLLDYTLYSHLGLVHALLRQIPFYRGMKEEDRILSVRDTTYTVSLLVSIAVGITLLAASFFLTGYSSMIISGMRVVAVLVVLQQMYFFITAVYGTDKRFIFLGKTLVLFSSVNIVLAILLAIRYSAPGVLAALAVSYLITVGYLFKEKRYPLSISFDKERFLSLFKIGFPIVLMSLIYTLLKTVDRLIIIGFLSATELGYYGIAVVVESFVFYLPAAASWIIGPWLYEGCGAKMDIKELRNYLVSPIQVISYLIPVVIGIIYITFPYFANIVIPDFSPAIPVVKILLIASFFISMNNVVHQFVIMLNKQHNLVLFGAITVVLSASLNYYFLLLGWGIQGIALGTLIAYAFYTTSIIIYSMRYYISEVSGLLTFLFKTYATIIYAGICLFVVERLPVAGFLGIVVKSTAFLVLQLPTIYLLEKKTGVVTDAVHVLKDLV